MSHATCTHVVFMGGQYCTAYSQEPPLTSDAGMSSCVATTADTSGVSGAYAVHGHEYEVLAGASDRCVASGSELIESSGECEAA